jgi:serine/threonine protein kinase
MANFKDLEQLGQGGFGVVHKCAQESDGSLFAKKTLWLSDTASIKRFQREVRIIQRLNHPGIIRIVETQLIRPPYWYVMPLYRAVSGRYYSGFARRPGSRSQNIQRRTRSNGIRSRTECHSSRP